MTLVPAGSSPVVELIGCVRNVSSTTATVSFELSQP